MSRGKRGTSRPHPRYNGKVLVGFYIPVDMYSWLVAQAGLRGCSLVQIVRDVIRIRMDEVEKNKARGVTSTISRGVQSVTARLDAPIPEELP
jgi:hypothetical protein